MIGWLRRSVMTTIKATCPTCGDVDLTPADVAVTVARELGWSTYTFTCPSCGDDVTKAADDDVVHLLSGAGVRVERLRVPREFFEEQALMRDAMDLTADDVLDFALWLEGTDDIVGGMVEKS